MEPTAIESLNGRVRWISGNRWLLVISLFGFAMGIVIGGYRSVARYHQPGPSDGIREGFVDFHNGIYYPSLALSQGISPYGSEYAKTFPVSRQIPFFSPAIVAMHIPITWLPLHAAEATYFAIMIALVIAIAGQSTSAAGLGGRLDWLMATAAAIVWSRAGHVTLYNAYFTFELILASIIAIRYAKSKPLVSAIALTVVSGKPTFILPLGLLMLARGDFRAIMLGAVFSILSAAVPLAFLSHREGDGDLMKGLGEIRVQISEAQDVHHHEPNEIPALSWTRIDFFAILAKWTNSDPSDALHLVAMGILFLPPGWLLWRRTRLGKDDGVGGITGGLILLSMVVGLYRQSYDVLLLVPTVVGVAAGVLPVWSRSSVGARIILAALMTFPAFNYLSSQSFLTMLPDSKVIFLLLTSSNALSLTLAWVWVYVIGQLDSDRP